MLPLWPRLMVPGWGQNVRPCGFPPVAMTLITSPVAVLRTTTVPWKRLETQSWVPSGETAAMSGEPPTSQVSTTWRVATSITEMVPA